MFHFIWREWSTECIHLFCSVIAMNSCIDVGNLSESINAASMQKFHFNVTCQNGFWFQGFINKSNLPSSRFCLFAVNSLLCFVGAVLILFFFSSYSFNVVYPLYLSMCSDRDKAANIMADILLFIKQKQQG